MTSGPCQSKAGRHGAVLGVSLALIATGIAAEPDTGPSAILFFGQMTDNVWEDSLQPWKTDFIDSWLLGIGVGHDWPTRWRKVTLGVEAQIVGHFGRQDHFEVNLPLLIRYHPDTPFPAALESLAFGIGLSTASKRPQTEIDRDGETSRTLIYWMGEAEFGLPLDNTTFVFRLHHRSDAYGVFDTDSGSNALAFGVKRRF